MKPIQHMTVQEFEELMQEVQTRAETDPTFARRFMEQLSDKLAEQAEKLLEEKDVSRN